MTSRTYSIRLTANQRAQIVSGDPGLSFGCLAILLSIGCPRIIRTCSFSRFSPLRWNRWCCGIQNFQNYSSRVKAKRHTLPKSAYYPVQSLDQVSVGESFFLFLLKDQTGNKVLARSATPASTTDPLAWYLLESLRAKCGINWMSVAPKFSSISSSFLFAEEHALLSG